MYISVNKRCTKLLAISSKEFDKKKSVLKGEKIKIMPITLVCN